MKQTRVDAVVRATCPEGKATAEDLLQMLMQEVQYAVNRLTADQQQPQVRNDLMTALAVCRLTLERN